MKVQGYLDVPPGEGPFPLVLILHGGEMIGGEVYGAPFHDNAFPAWDADRAASTAYFNNAVVFMPNYAGWGESSGYVGSAYDDYVDAMNGMRALSHIQDLHIASETYLYGTSVGGDVAMLIASHDPLVKAMFLWSPYPGASETLKWLEDQPQASLSVDDIAILGDFIRMFGQDVSSQIYRENSPDYRDIDVPTLIIAGDRDPYYPESLMRDAYGQLSKHDHQAELHFFPGGHAPDAPAVDQLSWKWMEGNFKRAIL